VLVGAAHGFKKMEYSAVSLNFVQLLVRIVLIGFFALVGLNAYLTVVAFGLSDVAAVVVLIYLLNKTFPWKRPLSSARRDIREISSFSLPLWLSGVLKKSRKRIEIIVLGSLSTVTAVGIYSLISRINLIGRVAYLSVLASVKPVIAELYAKRDWVQMGGLYQTTTRWTFTLNLPMFLIMVLFPESILAIFGRSFVNGATALTIMACAELVNAGTGTCGSIIDMTGHTKLKLVNSILWIIVSLSSNILLVPRWGVLGAATAVLISTSLINLLRVVEVWVLFRMLPYNLKFAKPVAAALAAFTVALVIDQWFSAQTGLLIVVFQMLIVITMYAGVLILLGLAPEDRTVVARMYRRIGYHFLPKQSSTRHHLP
jgi:O-antigen/teichoic acid export membrane protein